MRNTNTPARRGFLIGALVAFLIPTFVLPLNSQGTATNEPSPSSSKAGTAPANPTTTTGKPTTGKPTTGVPPAPKTPANRTSSVNAVTKAAVQVGVLSSASRINQVTSFLMGNSKSSAYLFTPRTQPDRSLFSVSMGLEGNAGAVAYATASFAPTTSGQVAAVYDSVQYLAQTCEDVEKKVFKNLKRKGTLGKDIVVMDGGPVTVFLMPAGPGCIVVKKEVVQ